jgi:hypothetical protein
MIHQFCFCCSLWYHWKPFRYLPIRSRIFKCKFVFLFLALKMALKKLLMQTTAHGKFAYRSNKRTRGNFRFCIAFCLSPVRQQQHLFGQRYYWSLSSNPNAYQSEVWSTHGRAHYETNGNNYQVRKHTFCIWLFTSIIRLMRRMIHRVLTNLIARAMSLFPGMPTMLSQALVTPLNMAHKAWWKIASSLRPDKLSMRQKCFWLYEHWLQHNTLAKSVFARPLLLNNGVLLWLVRVTLYL